MKFGALGLPKSSRSLHRQHGDSTVGPVDSVAILFAGQQDEFSPEVYDSYFNLEGVELSSCPNFFDLPRHKETQKLDYFAKTSLVLHDEDALVWFLVEGLGFTV